MAKADGNWPQADVAWKLESRIICLLRFYILATSEIIYQTQWSNR